MTGLTSRRFWTDAIERATKTVAQSAAALLLGDGAGLLTIDWVAVASVAGLAGLVSLLTSIGSAQVGDDTASLT